MVVLLSLWESILLVTVVCSLPGTWCVRTAIACSCCLLTCFSTSAEAELVKWPVWLEVLGASFSFDVVLPIETFMRFFFWVL